MAFSSLPDLRESLSVIPPSFTSFQIRPRPPLSPFLMVFLSSSSACSLQRCISCLDSASFSSSAEDSQRLTSQEEDWCEGEDDRDGDEKSLFQESGAGTDILNFFFFFVFFNCRLRLFHVRLKQGAFYRFTQESRWKYGVDLSSLFVMRI